MASVPPGTVRQFLFNAPDAEVLEAVCSVEYDGTYDEFHKATRGRWSVALVQQVDSRDIIGITHPVEIRDPRKTPFRLGVPASRLVYGRPVFLNIEYSATDGPEPLFWASAIAVDCTTHLA